MCYLCGVGGYLFLACKDFGRMFDHSRQRFFFFLKWTLACPLFMPGSVHIGSVSLDDFGQMFPDKLHVSCFWTAALSAQSDFVGSRVYVCWFRCNLLPVFLAEWAGSFICHCGNIGMERTPNKSQHTKVTLEKKICVCACDQQYHYKWLTWLAVLDIFSDECEWWFLHKSVHIKRYYFS